MTDAASWRSAGKRVAERGRPATNARPADRLIAAERSLQRWLVTIIGLWIVVGVATVVLSSTLEPQATMPEPSRFPDEIGLIARIAAIHADVLRAFDNELDTPKKLIELRDGLTESKRKLLNLSLIAIQDPSNKESLGELRNRLVDSYHVIQLHLEKMSKRLRNTGSEGTILPEESRFAQARLNDDRNEIVEVTAALRLLPLELPVQPRALRRIYGVLNQTQN